MPAPLAPSRAVASCWLHRTSSPVAGTEGHPHHAGGEISHCHGQGRAHQVCEPGIPGVGAWGTRVQRAKLQGDQGSRAAAQAVPGDHQAPAGAVHTLLQQAGHVATLLLLPAASTARVRIQVASRSRAQPQRTRLLWMAQGWVGGGRMRNRVPVPERLPSQAGLQVPLHAPVRPALGTSLPCVGPDSAADVCVCWQLAADKFLEVQRRTRSCARGCTWAQTSPEVMAARAASPAGAGKLLDGAVPRLPPRRPMQGCLVGCAPARPCSGLAALAQVCAVPAEQHAQDVALRKVLRAGRLSGRTRRAACASPA